VRRASTWIGLNVTLIAAYALMAAFVPPAAAQSETPLPLRLEDVDIDAHPEITLIVSVPRELVGTEIAPGQFTLTENGTVTEATVEAVPSDDLEVVLVLDVSGSMSGSPLAAAQSAALSFIEQMPTGVKLALVTFANTTLVASPFSTDKELAASAVTGLGVGGETALYDGLVVSADQFEAIVPTRRTIVLLSDGGDTTSESTLETALIALLNKEVSFYAIELQSPENDPEALARLAAATKGVVVPATDPAALEGIFDEIAAQLTNQYRLTYQSGASGPTEVVVTVEVDGTIAATRGTLRLPPASIASPTTATGANPDAPSEPELAPTRPGSLVQLTFWQQRVAFYLGLALIVAALFGILFFSGGLITKPNPVRLLSSGQVNRLAKSKNPTLSALADRATEVAERSLQGERGNQLHRLLEQGGFSIRPAEFVVLTAIAGVVGFAIGYLVFGIQGGVVGALLSLVLVRLYVGRQANKRKAAFAEQLSDALYLMAGSLRAGFGLLQAIDVVAAEAPSPTAEEFQRVKVEIHLGRDMDEALEAMAERVGSEDFKWVTEGIQIHREVGGDIADIIDSVNGTIRDRNRIRRRIRSLSAEGRISAIVLIVLPLALGVILTVINPAYVGELTGSEMGRVLIVVGSVAMVVGVVWINKIIKIEF
jgi:tight adherence protein B